jgi:hypothetical protein
VPKPQATNRKSGSEWPRFAERLEDRAKRAKPLSEDSLTVLGIRINQESVDVAENVLGPSQLRSQGDAAESLHWRCWEAANGDGTVLVIGRGELDGVVRVFGPEMAFPERGTCPASDKVSKTLATASGIRLGLSRDEIEKRVGPATKAAKGWYQHFAMSTRPMTEEEKSAWKATPPYDIFAVFSGIRVVENGGRAVGFQIAWSESN